MKVKLEDEIILTKLDNEIALLNQKNGRYFSLNETGARIWELLCESGDTEKAVNVILEEISRISPFSQDLQIKFKSKNGWKGYLKIWLYPQIYYGKPSGSKTDFSEIFLVEKDPTFLNWENIYYLDSSDTGSYEIYLNTLDKWDRYCNHISGICLVSWLDFVK